MWKADYTLEPFDLRLTMLRMVRNLGRIILFTLIGTLIFGGGYYVKNVILGEKPRYEMTITCKIEYTDPPTKSGDYYINEMTWNTYLHSDEFVCMLNKNAPFVYMDVTLDMWAGGIRNALSAAVASDIHVPSFTVSLCNEDKARTLCGVVQEVLTKDFAESIPEVAQIQVIDVSEPELMRPDVRPVRAFILSAVLSCFFVTVFFLLNEIGADSIWLPATLRRRYGLKTLGTIHSPELKENAGRLFKDIDRIAVCASDKRTNLQDVINFMQEIIHNGSDKFDESGETGSVEWTEIPYLPTNPERVKDMHEAQGILLVVESGLHAGKPLEYLLEFLETQELTVTGALLWNADETLIRCYYFLPDGRE